MRWRPFLEWRPDEIGIGFSFSVDRVHNYGLGKLADPDRSWCPNIWIHVGPVIAGIGWSSR